MIGERIKECRISQGLTQEELAEKMGYSGKGMISKIESGKVDLSLSKIKEFAEVLNTTQSALMGWDVPDTPQEFSSVCMKIGLSDERFQKIVLDYFSLPTTLKGLACTSIESVLSVLKTM